MEQYWKTARELYNKRKGLDEKIMLPNRMDIVIAALKFRINYLENLGVKEITDSYGLEEFINKFRNMSNLEYIAYHQTRQRQAEINHLKNAIRHLEKEMGK